MKIQMTHTELETFLSKHFGSEVELTITETVSEAPEEVVEDTPVECIPEVVETPEEPEIKSLEEVSEVAQDIIASATGSITKYKLKQELNEFIELFGNDKVSQEVWKLVVDKKVMFDPETEAFYVEEATTESKDGFWYEGKWITADSPAFNFPEETKVIEVTEETKPKTDDSGFISFGTTAEVKEEDRAKPERNNHSWFAEERNAR